MPNPRELSQFGSFVEIDDLTKNIGIATDTTPYVGIGTLSPATKVHVVGDVTIDGSVNVDQQIIGIATITNLNLNGGQLDNLSYIDVDNITVSGVTTSGVVTGATYYGDAQYLSNVGLAVTYIDNDVTIDGNLTADNLTLSGVNAFDLSNISVSGVTTASGVEIKTGIVTAGAGTTTVVYYGDGYNITNIQCSALTGFQVAVFPRPAGRWVLGQDIIKVVVAADNTVNVEARAGIVTVSIGNAAIPPLTVK